MHRKTEKSRELHKRAEQMMPGGVNSPVRAFGAVGCDPVFLVRGQGSHVWDADGNEYIDYLGSWGPLILGHAAAEVVEAVTAAARNGMSFGASTPADTRPRHSSLDRGVPLEVVSAILGHASLAITADVYARVTLDAKRRALEVLSEAFESLK